MGTNISKIILLLLSMYLPSEMIENEMYLKTNFVHQRAINHTSRFLLNDNKYVVDYLVFKAIFLWAKLFLVIIYQIV